MATDAAVAVRSMQIEKTGRGITMADLKKLYLATGRELPTAVSYEPEFRDDVFVVGQGTETEVNPLYCSTVPSAVELALILEDICMRGFLAQPCAMAVSSPFVYSSDVPWLQFSNGAQRNAAQLSQYWKANSGDPGGKTAEEHARQDIAWG